MTVILGIAGAPHSSLAQPLNQLGRWSLLSGWKSVNNHFNTIGDGAGTHRMWRHVSILPVSNDEMLA